jgi:hypothetical protein
LHFEDRIYRIYRMNRITKNLAGCLNHSVNHVNPVH